MVVSARGSDVTVYVFDSGALIDLFHHYYPARFPTLWEQFGRLVSDNQISSTREVYNELIEYGDDVSEWCNRMRQIFTTPNLRELTAVREIFQVNHFQAMIRKKERLAGRPVADPFVIAKARNTPDSCVVTTEKNRPNAAKIPNVCDHFRIDWENLEGFMERENWSF